MSAYYNEIDPKAAAWLRELINAGHIAPGEVDERDIRDVRPTDLTGFQQCHFFAGIGVWSYALRRAGWPDHRPIWSGSCPCQPFSQAGGRAGFADERHLWPSFFHLIEQCEPTAITGEQVASSHIDPWIDLVQADLEALDYAFACVPIPAAGVGSPNIRERSFWVANRERIGVRGSRHGAPAGAAGGMQGEDGQWQRIWADAWSGRPFVARGLADLLDEGCERRGRGWQVSGPGEIVRPVRRRDDGPTRGFWANPEWVSCRDQRWRPIEPGTFPLAHGAPARVGRLRGYGNAINAEVATAFIEAVMDHLTSESLAA